jgi:hypothetical protein
MRVKISYSVNFDDVPKIVNDKLAEISLRLSLTKREIDPDGPFGEISDSIKKLDAIDTVRRKMATLDAELEDCYSILAGYNKALADMKLPKAEPVEETPNDGD